MADKKISQLTALSAANLAPSTDVLAIVDTSATETKKIVAQDLINGVLNVASAVGIGTASPGTKLDVRGSVTSQADTAYYRIRRASSADVGYITDSGTWGDSGTDFAIGASSSNLRFYTNNSATERMRLDSSGNLGLGVTPSAWWTGASAWRAMNLGQGASLSSRASTEVMYLSSNWYFDGAEKYITTGNATQYMQNAGQHIWKTAPSWNGTGSDTISFTQALTLTANRNLLVNTTTENSGNGGLKVNGQFALAVSQGVTASATVDNNAYYVVCYSLSGTCTLTLPTPANNTGRLLNIVVQSAQQVVSASSNVTKITDGSVTTEILPATAGKWAQLWCDGSYWNIIATNV